MAAPKQTIWQLEPHTRAKHEILKRYLQAWMIILSQGRFPEILYIDGFAGPGQYAGGEAGSPIIAIDTALGHASRLTAKVNFLFVEKDEERADHLKQQIALRTLPSNFNIIVEGGITFEAAFDKRHSQFVRNGRLMPTFAFIDPFGWKGTPFEIVRRIMAQRSCEVFINFMYEEINRFLNHPDQVANFNTFFGAAGWNLCLSEINPRSRNRCLHDLYMDQLHRTAGAKYVRSFEMSNERDVTDYFLFYVTNEILGLKKMKEAMWKADESGEFHFADSTNPNQFVLFEKAPKLDVLKAQLLAAFAGKTVTVRAIEEFVVVNTAFRETHYKGVLKALETQTGQLAAVNPSERRRAGQYPDQQMLVKFSA